MTQVISLEKRRAWLRLKKLVSGGQLRLPALERLPRELPTSDAAIALDFALSALKDGQKDHSK